MKTKFYLLVIFALCSSLAFATDSPAVSVVSGSSKHIFKVIYKAEVVNTVRVTIYNSSNEMVFTETFNDVDSFSRPYNFSSLPEGEYTIEVKDDTGKKIEKVNYNNGSVKSIISVLKLTDAPSKYMLTAVNEGANEITVSILNTMGDTLYNEILKVKGNFGVIYNLVEEGSYTFIVSDKTGVVKTINY
jgi:hypothetical protein